MSMTLRSSYPDIHWHLSAILHVCLHYIQFVMLNCILATVLSYILTLSPDCLADDEVEHLDKLFTALVKATNSHKLSAFGRDCVLELLIRNVTASDGLNWTRKFLETDGKCQSCAELCFMQRLVS